MAPAGWPFVCSSKSVEMPLVAAMPDHVSPSPTTYGRQPPVQQDGSPTGTEIVSPTISEVDEMPQRAIRAMDVTYRREML